MNQPKSTHKNGLTYGGLSVHIVRPIQASRFRISKDVEFSDEYRKEIDGFCDDLFGVDTQDVMEDGQIIRRGDCLFMSEKTADCLKKVDIEPQYSYNLKL